MSDAHSLAFVFAIMVGGAASAAAEDKPVEIPFKEIWALDIPGTRDVRKLEPEPERGLSADEIVGRSLVEQIRWSLNPNFWPKKGQDAGKAFVVVGTGKDALLNAHSVLAEKVKRAQSVPADKELTLVFYAYNSGRYVRLDEVQQQGNNLTVKYHLHAHELLRSSTHFALIPLGKLPPGKIQVNIERCADGGPIGLVRRFRAVPAERIVCGSFAFEIAHSRD